MFEHFDNLEKFDGMKRYSDSKLVLNVPACKLSTTTPADKIIVHNFFPEKVVTGLDNNLPGWLRPFIGLVRRFMALTMGEVSRTLERQR